jgi:hypothetical protein
LRGGSSNIVESLAWALRGSLENLVVVKLVDDAIMMT